jgi:hypothetical protein
MGFRPLPPRADPSIGGNMEMAASVSLRLREHPALTGSSIRPSTSAAPATQSLGAQP